jgi:hypothetical protein
MKKKILAIAQATPEASDLEHIGQSLSFLHASFDVDFIDPLSIMENIPNEAYYALWAKELKKRIPQYAGFLGFSFGGVILQQCLHLIEDTSKPVILISAPTSVNPFLSEHLGEVVRLCHKNQFAAAMDYLYSRVYFPNNKPDRLFEDLSIPVASLRMIFGLSRVLATDSKHLVTQSAHPLIHLVGALSQLVSDVHVSASTKGKVVIVPRAGMRVLQDNPLYAQGVIQNMLGM